ncbi:DUF1692-domain-containing protein [Phlegmacium glaucopus]|nr:DUF1692-domain-containing protein [Phlegmacium glaucopus]
MLVVNNICMRIAFGVGPTLNSAWIITRRKYLNINIDLVVAMPCGYLSVDLRDAMGDRLFLSGSIQQHCLQAKQSLSHATLAVYSTVCSGEKPLFKPMYNYEPAESACRISGTLAVERMTANLHITSLGHGYASFSNVDHKQMNFSHIVTEFSFGPHFPDLVHPLDNSFEATDKNLIAFQYFLHIVPTTYIAPRTRTLYALINTVLHIIHVRYNMQEPPESFPNWNSTLCISHYTSEQQPSSIFSSE